MAQSLRALALSEEDCQHPHGDSQPSVTACGPIFWPPQALGTHMMYRHICRENITLIFKFNLAKVAYAFSSAFRKQRHVDL